MKRTYRFFLLLYPRGHRDQFADEMTQVFEQAAAKSRAGGWAIHLRFAFSETAGLLAGAADAWLDRRPEAVPAAGESPALGWQPQELIEAQRRVDASVAAMVQAIAHHQFARARQLSNQERDARESLRVLREKYGDEYGMSL
jgi:hypothetical protein